MYIRLWKTLCLALLMATVGGVNAQSNPTTGLSVSGAWVRPSVAGNDVTAAYFHLTNDRADDQRLVAVETEAAAMTELHTVQMDGDVMRMRPVEGGIDVPAGETVVLKPGGLHVMLMGLEAQLDVGDSVSLRLVFESGAALDVGAWVSDTPIPHLLEPDALTEAAWAAIDAGTYIGQVVDPPIRVQDFTLPGVGVSEVSLSDSAGTWRMLFFGYMRCPDFCPLTLVDYRDIKALLGDVAEDVTFVFVSVDAARDTPDVLRDYLTRFDPDFIGFSADDATLSRIQPDYGFYYARQMGEGQQAVYSIDHSTRSYLVDPSGVLRASFAYHIDPALMADALRWYIGQE
ncbi:MAG: copper chaperone PCu(A)C [Anaerolineae bacterium]|jgi:protein SCO1/2|nr:copper chaperone PCu(A)C [Anaerolineae bacterium]